MRFLGEEAEVERTISQTRKTVDYMAKFWRSHPPYGVLGAEGCAVQFPFHDVYLDVF